MPVHDEEKSRFKILREQQSMGRENRLVYLNADKERGDSPEGDEPEY